MRRGKPAVLVAVLILLVLGSYVWYTQQIVTAWRSDAARSTDMYRRIFRALADTSPDAATTALLELSKDVQAQGVPIIVVDPEGRIAAHANLDFDPAGTIANDDPRI